MGTPTLNAELLALIAGLASLVAVLGGIGTVVWKLSAMSTKIDTLVEGLKEHASTKERLVRLETAIFNRDHSQ